MWRRIRRVGLLALLLGGLGCQHHKSSVNTKQPPDPLLISKKPVEGKPTSFERTADSRDPQANPAPAIPPGYRPAPDTGVSIGKPRWLPDNR